MINCDILTRVREQVHPFPDNLRGTIHEPKHRGQMKSQRNTGRSSRGFGGPERSSCHILDKSRSSSSPGMQTEADQLQSQHGLFVPSHGPPGVRRRCEPVLQVGEVAGYAIRYPIPCDLLHFSNLFSKTLQKRILIRTSVVSSACLE